MSRQTRGKEWTVGRRKSNDSVTTERQRDRETGGLDVSTTKCKIALMNRGRRGLSTRQRKAGRDTHIYYIQERCRRPIAPPVLSATSNPCSTNVSSLNVFRGRKSRDKAAGGGEKLLENCTGYAKKTGSYTSQTFLASTLRHKHQRVWWSKASLV